MLSLRNQLPTHSRQKKRKSLPIGKKDEICRMVFFAVLEGLYEDGVKDDVVENIIGKKSKFDDEEGMKQRMRRSFVMDCPLCQPTFEAFLTYQNRPKFNDGSGANKFESGLDDKLRKQLLSDSTQTRLEALKLPVQSWVLKKMSSQNPTGKQKAQWSKRITARCNEGSMQLRQLRGKDKNYKDWSGYWGCAACNASRDADSEFQTTEPAKK